MDGDSDDEGNDELTCVRSDESKFMGVDHGGRGKFRVGGR